MLVDDFNYYILVQRHHQHSTSPAQGINSNKQSSLIYVQYYYTSTVAMSHQCQWQDWTLLHGWAFQLLSITSLLTSWAGQLQASGVQSREPCLLPPGAVLMCAGLCAGLQDPPPRQPVTLPTRHMHHSMLRAMTCSRHCQVNRQKGCTVPCP